MDDRAAFEASVMARHADYEPELILFRNATGDYATTFIQGEWDGWQAAMARAVPSGWRTVPIEPTIEMMEGALNNITLSNSHAAYGVTKHAWAHMLKMAPAPPK